MQQLNITIEDGTLAAYKKYARQHGISLDEAIQRVLAQGVSPAQKDWLEECFRLMDEAEANSNGKRWCREDLYSVLGVDNA